MPDDFTSQAIAQELDRRAYQDPQQRALTPEQRASIRADLSGLMQKNQYRPEMSRIFTSQDPRDYIGLAVELFNRTYGAGQHHPVTVADRTPSLVPQSLNGTARPPAGYVELSSASRRPALGGAVVPRSLSEVYGTLLHEVSHVMGLPDEAPPGEPTASRLNLLNAMLNSDIELKGK